MQTEEEKKAKRSAQKKAYNEANKAKRSAQRGAYYEANKEKIAAQKKAYYEANKEKESAYRKANKEKIAARKKAYYEANKEEIAAYRKANKEKIAAYQKANPEVGAAGARKYRSTKLKAYVPRCSHWEGVEKQMVGRREELRAATGITYHIDHIYPLSKGGIDHPSNYQLLSPEENLSKGAKVDSSCPNQMRMKEVSELVLNLGMDIDSALQLTKRENMEVS